MKSIFRLFFQAWIAPAFGNFYNYGSNGGSGGSAPSSDLIASLANNALSAYQTTEIANANPLNAALITGGVASTRQGTAGGVSPLTSSVGGSSGILLLIAAVVVIFIIVK